MSTVSLRLPESVHKRVRELARKEGVSINQFIATATAEKISALLTGECIEEHTSRGNRKAFDNALKKVKPRAPDPGGAIDKK